MKNQIRAAIIAALVGVTIFFCAAAFQVIKHGIVHGSNL
jgi:hypothetical protein